MTVSFRSIHNGYLCIPHTRCRRGRSPLAAGEERVGMRGEFTNVSQLFWFNEENYFFKMKKDEKSYNISWYHPVQPTKYVHGLGFVVFSCSDDINRFYIYHSELLHKSSTANEVKLTIMGTLLYETTKDDATRKIHTQKQCIFQGIYSTRTVKKLDVF